MDFHFFSFVLRLMHQKRRSTSCTHPTEVSQYGRTCVRMGDIVETIQSVHWIFKYYGVCYAPDNQINT